jgi:hypothetical protein
MALAPTDPIQHTPGRRADAEWHRREREGAEGKGTGGGAWDLPQKVVLVHFRCT